MSKKEEQGVVAAPPPPQVKDNHEASGKSPDTVPTSTSNYSTKRKVKFDGLFFEGSYWIVKLGQIKNDQYQYAIISGPLTSFVGTRFSLYVLAQIGRAHV